MRAITTILGLNSVRQIVERVGLDALMDEMISRLTVAFRTYDPTAIHVPIRQGFSYAQPTLGLLEWMPTLEVGKRAMIKVVGYHPCNASTHQLPTIMSNIGMYEAETGHLVTLIDGNFITALRTGAASAVASTALAHPDSRTLGLIGCGAQAVTQFHALSRVFDVSAALISDPDPSARNSFQRRVSTFADDIPIIIASPDEIVSRVDILSTQTSVAVGGGPVFTQVPSKPWMHLNAVGSDFPGKIEVPLAHLLDSFVCPDFTPQATVEGECQQLTEEHSYHIGPSLSEVVRRRSEYRFAQDQLSVFDSTGFGLEDYVGVQMMLDYATELGIGIAAEIEAVPDDAKNPYQFTAARAESTDQERRRWATHRRT